MKKLLILTIVLAMMAVSCSIGSANDEENIALIISEFENMLITGFSFTEEETDSKAAINTLGWYRERTGNINFNADIEVIDDSAYVSIDVEHNGVIHIAYLGDSLDTLWAEKDFTANLLRYAIFKKDTNRNYHGGWRLYKLTCGHIDADYPDSTGLIIDSVRIYADDIIDTMITDIEFFFEREDLISLPMGELISIDVYSPSVDNVYFIHSNIRRGRFTVDGDHYTGEWRVPVKEGIYRCVIDGLTPGTLLDDTEPYNSVDWFIPYRAE